MIELKIVIAVAAGIGAAVGAGKWVADRWESDLLCFSTAIGAFLGTVGLLSQVLP